MKRKDKHQNAQKIDTIIGPNAKFEGTVTSREGLRIDGQVRGKVECVGTLVIGGDGKVEAEVTADNVFIAGELIGNVTARKRLQVTEKGKVYGDISASELVLEEGVVFEGKCHMLKQEEFRKDSESSSDLAHLSLAYAEVKKSKPAKN